MLIAARDKCCYEIDVTEGLKGDGNEEKTGGRIAVLYGKSTFHSSDQVKEDGFKKDDIYVDLGDDPPDEMDEELSRRLTEVA